MISASTEPCVCVGVYGDQGANLPFNKRSIVSILHAGKHICPKTDLCAIQATFSQNKALIITRRNEHLPEPTYHWSSHSLGLGKPRAPCTSVCSVSIEQGCERWHGIFAENYVCRKVTSYLCRKLIMARGDMVSLPISTGAYSSSTIQNEGQATSIGFSRL